MIFGGRSYALIGLLTLVGVTAVAQSRRVPAVEGVTTRLGGEGAGDSVRISGEAGHAREMAGDFAATERTLSGKVQAAAVQSAVTYTCDPTINAVAGLCNTLNSTTAGVFTSAFSNVNANIYIRFGNSGLGQSDFPVGLYSYAEFRNALQADLNDSNDNTAFADSVPAAEPLNAAALVRLTNSNARALGFAPTMGFQADGLTFCSLGAGGCYDGVITISSSIQSAGRFYFRAGSIASNQYDFFSVAQHETDEVLGTASCAFGCPANRIWPSDLYRYQSNGARSFAAGNNSSCSSANAGNACFSIDGVHMLQQYYNLDDGHDPGDWVSVCSQPLVQGATGCLGAANVNISPAAEILVLDVIGYTLSGTGTGTGSGPAVTDTRTSLSTGVVNGSCIAPPALAAFTPASPQVWVYVAVTGAISGDSARIVFSRPGGVTQTTVIASATFPVNGAACISGSMLISGTSAASFPGSWTATVFWNQSGTPLATLNFTISGQACSYALASGGETFAAAGGAGSISVTAPAGCGWSVVNVPFWISLSGGPSGSGNGTLNFQVAANVASFRSVSLMVAGLGFSVEQAPASFPGMAALGSLAHVTSEGTWKYTLNATNLSGSTATVRFNFLNDTGGAQMFPFTFPLMPGSPPWMAATLDRNISSNAQLILDTTGPDSVAPLTGSGQVLASGNVGVFGIFSDPTFGWNAVVPLETRNAAKYVLAFDNTSVVCGALCLNPLATGVAVANVAAAAANIPVIIRDDRGVQIGTANINLAAQGHTSFMLNQQYPATANLRGTIEFDTPGFGTPSAGQISVLGLRANGGALTTLPVLASTDTPGGAIAHATFNGGFTSVFYLVNTGNAAASFTLSFFDKDGNPLSVPLSLPQTGATVNTSALVQMLGPGAILVVETIADDTALAIVGSAQLTATGSVSGFEIFRWTTFGQEASVPLETRTPASFVLVFDDTNGLTTGVALSNAASSAANVTARIFDGNGVLLETDAINLAGQGHTSFLLPVNYPVTANRRGMVEFVVPAGGKITAVGLRAKSDGTLTTIPVLVR